MHLGHMVSIRCHWNFVLWRHGRASPQILALRSASYATYFCSVTPSLLTLDTALAACLDSWSLNQPSYSFGMPFPPSMRGMNAVAGQAISRRAQIKRTIIVLKMPTAARKGLERFWVERVITFLKRDERKIARFFLPRNRATRHLDPSRPHANDMLRSPSGRYNNKVEK